MPRSGICESVHTFCDTGTVSVYQRENEPIMVALMLKFAVSSNRVDCIVARRNRGGHLKRFSLLASTSSDETVARGTCRLT